MLYDPKWERSFAPPPPTEKGDRFWLLATAFIPVLILSETVAVALENVLLLVVPLTIYIAAMLWVASRLRSPAKPED